MKEYLKYTIEVKDQAQNDILIAQLSAMGIEGFEEQDGLLIAMGKTDEVDRSGIEGKLIEMKVAFKISLEAEQNWNALWESNFPPVVVDDFVGVRAYFHHPFTQVEHDIIITPKMSFGTGHHATTWQMMQLMRTLPVAGAQVFDFGTGTGVLAILAEKMGARAVEAIDYDDWSVNNGLENIAANGCTRIKLWKSDKPENITPADIVLANINKHIILTWLVQLIGIVKPGGTLLLSGLLRDDEVDIVEAINQFGYQKKAIVERNGWIAMVCVCLPSNVN